jgi:hypothetical protein
MRLLSVDEVQCRVLTTHSHSVSLDVETYVNTRTKARFVDVIHGEWWAIPGNVIRGSRHPLRAKPARDVACRANALKSQRKSLVERRHFSLDDVVRRLATVHDGQVTLDEQTYVNMSTPALFTDAVHGVFRRNPCDVISLGRRHPQYSNDRKRAKLLVPIDIIKARIAEVHGNIVTLVDSTYHGARKEKACFIDVEYGEWWALPYRVAKGHSHPKRWQRKMAVSATDATSVFHWRTSELCWARASYERATLMWLNSRRHDYDWQIPFTTPFLTPNGMQSIYYVDLYIKDGPYADTYVEIKGTWNRKNGHVGKAKWEWFHSAYPNSELWMKDDLKKRGVLA